MKFLLDHDVPEDLTYLLQELGHEFQWRVIPPGGIRGAGPGISKYAVSDPPLPRPSGDRLGMIVQELHEQPAHLLLGHAAGARGADQGAAAYGHPRISPDGTRIALASADQQRDVWIWDVARDILSRLTLDPAFDAYPVWTPDGRQIIFASERNGALDLYRQASDNTGTVERLATSANVQVPYAMSPDGTQVVFTEVQQTGFDVMLLRLDGKAQAQPLVQTKFQETQGTISPDGRWLAYQSDESGQNEVHVRPFPNVDGGHWQVSSAGGVKPTWAPSGRELFYLAPTRAMMAMMAVAVHATATFTYGNATKLFDAPYYQPALGRVYDVSRDGQKFLMIKDAPSGDPAGSGPPSGLSS